MRARVSQQHKTKPPKKAAVWPAILFATAAVAWTAVMVASLHWRFLDRFVVGAWHGQIGIDFFQIPRGYGNLLIGNSIFLTDTGAYGPYATMYLYHPLVAVAIGPWTAPLAPWTAYGLFVGVSLGLLLLSAWLLASAFQTPAYRGFVYFALFCSLPTYLMLWNAQAHVLLVVAVAMILGGLMRLEQEPPSEKRYGRWIQLGLLVALLSKPVVVLMLPVLFLLPETRRTLLLPLAIYAAVSLLFLLVGGLNPGGYNGIHWLNIMSVAASPMQSLNRLVPTEFDFQRDPGLYSLPIFVNWMLGRPAPSFSLKLPLVAVLAMSLSPLVLDDRGQRLRAALVTVSLCILSHFLCYYPVQEYHYTTLLPVLPALLWLWQREGVAWFRGLLMASFVVSLLVFVPTPYFLAPQEPQRFHAVNILQRVVPVAVAFCCLTVYGLAFTWAARRRPRWITPPMRDRLWPTLRLGGVLGILLGSVLAAAYWTVPSRLLSTPSKWTNQDFRKHYEETVAALERAVADAPACVEARINLGQALATEGQLAAAIAQFQRALEIEPDNLETHGYLGDALVAAGRREEAIAQFRGVLKIDPNNVAGHYSLGDGLASVGRLDEAMAQYRKVLEIQPRCAEAHANLGNVLAGRGQFAAATPHLRQAVELQPNNVDFQKNWAWLLATCPEASLRNGVEAIEHAQQANQLCGGSRADVLDVLAAAYAEAGWFPQALATARNAMELATRQNDRALADALRARMAGYEAGKPYHPTRPASAPAR